MELTGLGGGIMLAIAACLWLLYLVPNWLKRREYLATEKNAVRLQQTIRVLAETAEASRPRRADAEARLAASAPVAVGRPVRNAARDRELARLLATRRLRRTRALTALVLLAAIVVVILQLALMVTTGAVVASWLVLVASLVVGGSSVAMLGRLADVSRSRRTEVARPARRVVPATVTRQQPAVVRNPEWTPVPVPKPLYLSRSSAEEQAATDITFELEAAAARAEQALRSAERETPSIRPAAASASAFARMGIVDDAGAGTPDLDAVLARRRAAG